MPYGIVSFVPLNFLLCNGTIFFILVGVLVNLLWCSVSTFYCPLRKKRCTLLPEGTESTHSAVHSSKRTFVCHYITMLRLLLNWKKHKQGIQLCYSTYNQTKQHFKIPICFLFQRMSLRNLFLSGFIYLGCGCMTSILRLR